MTSSSYQIGEFITCWEQNIEDPTGFTDPIWSDTTSDQCQESPDLCNIYMTQEPNAGKGDVCDHADPNTGNIRNTCYMNVQFGEQVDLEKTWSFKCWDQTQCPVKDANGNGIPGCKITNKRISCCCNDADYCNGQDLFLDYAQWGRADADWYPPNFDTILGYDTGDVVVDTSELNTGAHSVFMQQPMAGYNNGYNGYNGNHMINVADILLIFTFFVIGILCLGIGVFIGAKWKKSVIVHQKDDMQLNDI